MEVREPLEFLFEAGGDLGGLRSGVVEGGSGVSGCELASHSIFLRTLSQMLRALAVGGVAIAIESEGSSFCFSGQRPHEELPRPASGPYEVSDR